MRDVLYDRDGHIAIITLNRPERLNALNQQLSRELAETWLRFRDDEAAHVAILRGEGRAFCAGRDLKEIADTGNSSRFQHPVPDIYGTAALAKPVIAAVHGYAIAGGFLLAAQADLRIAAETAVFAMPQARYGIYARPLPFVSALVPTAFIAELFLTGEPVTAQRCYDVGLLNRVVPADRLLDEALAMAAKVASFPPLAIRTTMRTLRQAVAPNEAAQVLVDVGYREADLSGEIVGQTQAFAARQLRPLSR